MSSWLASAVVSQASITAFQPRLVAVWSSLMLSSHQVAAMPAASKRSVPDWSPMCAVKSSTSWWRSPVRLRRSGSEWQYGFGGFGPPAGPGAGRGLFGNGVVDSAVRGVSPVC